MPKRLKRYYGAGHLHFVTCSCYQRRPLLGRAGARNLFVHILGEVRERYRFSLVGYVVMPDHIHLLMSEPEGGTPSGKGGAPELPRFWQRRFYDFNVWSHKKRREKLDYMHSNPVKRGLVRRPQDWPWSSYAFYAGEDPTLRKAKGGAPTPVRIDPV